jgi:hypothetical protein
MSDPAPVKRPNALQWLWYSLGGALPPDRRTWVLHDTTAPTWVLRQVLRTLLILAPFVVILLLFIPGPFWVRGLAVLGGIIMGLIFALAYVVETTEHRLIKAGYPAGTGESVRQERSAQLSAAAVARRRARMFERMDRRFER